VPAWSKPSKSRSSWNGAKRLPVNLRDTNWLD